MSVYQVNKLFYGLGRDMEFVSRFWQNKDDVLKGYELTEEEKEAIKNADLPRLYRMGVHPILMMAFSAANGIGLLDYFSIIKTVSNHPEQPA
jgi:hypothetical protein